MQRRVRSFFRRVSRLSKTLLTTPLDTIATFVLVTSIITGLIVLTEPAFSLRFRRGIQMWKVAPLLCKSAAFRAFVDTVYKLGNIPDIAIVLHFVKPIIMFVCLPLVALFKAVANPRISRSIILLVGFPSALLSLLCRVPAKSIKHLPHGVDSLSTWIITTIVILTLMFRYPAVLQWAISDLSVPVYLTILAIALTFVLVQEMLVLPQDDSNPIQKKNQSTVKCWRHVTTFSLYMFAGVISVWIIRVANEPLACFQLISDVRHISTKRRLA